MPIFEWRSIMPAPADELYEYHARPGAFKRLAPPWQKLRVLEQSGDVTGGRVAFEVRFGPVKRRWTAEMGGSVPGRQFVDRQLDGPFSAWEHTHRFVPVDDERSELIDHIEYRLPAGGITDAVGEGPAGRTLERFFRFRHERTRRDFERHAVWAGRPRMTVAIAGAGGLVGAHLADYLTTAGHRVVKLVRRAAAGDDEIAWDPAAGKLDPDDLAGVDAVVNLGGVTISGVWTSTRKKAILESRVQATQTLAAAITRMDQPPRVFVSASAVGAYGSRGADVITEQAGLGAGFLADVCRAWEASAAPVSEAGVRVVNARFGIVLSAAGGALATMLPAFKTGLGARLGDGSQYWAWIGLDDLLAALEWAISDDGLSGPVNMTAPEPVTNAAFTRTLAHVLRRPAVLKAPGFVLRHGLGGMGEEMLLASQRVEPARLSERGFRFTYPSVKAALRFELGRG